MLVLVLIKPSKLCSIGLKSRKQRAASEDHEMQETNLHLNKSSHDNSGKDLGSHYSEESSPLEEPVLEAPLAKRIRADDYIEIIDSDCDVAAEDEPVTIDSFADIATSQDDIRYSSIITFKKLACAITHTLHEQQKYRGVFASAREIDDVSTARSVKKIASLNKLVHSTCGVCSSIVQTHVNEQQRTCVP